MGIGIKLPSTRPPLLSDFPITCYRWAVLGQYPVYFTLPVLPVSTSLTIGASLMQEDAGPAGVCA